MAEISRRQFLKGATIGAAGAAVPTQHASGAPQGSMAGISAEGMQRISDTEQQLAQQGGVTGAAVDAVADLGLDPNGQEPINEKIESQLSEMSGRRITFPQGTFLVNDSLTLNPNGALELIGNNATLKVAPDTQAHALDCPNLPGGTTIRGFTIDQTASGAVSGVRIGSSGTVELRDVSVKGFSPPSETEQITGPVAGVLMPIARTPESAVRIVNFEAIGGTAAGMHTDPDKPDSAPENRLGAPIGMWVGGSNQGTVQLINARMRGWSNGTYSSRTSGRIEILGGMLWNNSNTQVRIGGGSIIDGATLLLDDRRWDMNSNPGPYSLGGNQGVNAIRIETGGSKGNQSNEVRITNTDIRGMSMGKTSALIDIEGSAPATLIRNCRFTNNIDQPSILGAAPGSGTYGGAARTNITLDRCTITGAGHDPSIQIDDRPQSSVANTCLQFAGASDSNIVGASTTNVSFGSQCSAGANANVGSNANVSAELGDMPPLPPPSSGSSGPGFAQIAAAFVSQAVLVVFVFGMFAVSVCAFFIKKVLE